MDKTIKVKLVTYTKLKKLAEYGDTMDAVISRLLPKSKKKGEGQN